MMFFIISVLLSALLLVTSSPQLQSGEGMDNDQIYYIIASSASSCLVGRCLTLSQFARNTSLYLMENTTLIFKDDIHTLDSQLLINGAHNFSARAERMTSNFTVIMCRKSFVFENLSEVYIDGLLFVGCRNNHIKSVMQFSITNCTFDGQHDNGTALFIIDSNAIISGCRFIRTLTDSIFYYNPLQYYESSDQIVVGGAIIGNNSDISISGCFFEENMAQVYGAVIVIENKSKLVITDTKFHQNQISLRGRGVYADNGCSVVVANSSFLDNTFDDGTLIEAYESSILFQECIFHHNHGNTSVLIRCFDSNVTLTETLIEFNYMFGCIGVTVSNVFLPTSLNINNSAFISNRVSSLLVVVGCFIGNCSTLTVSIQGSHFVKNINEFTAIYNLAGSMYMYVRDCTFAGNRAQSGVIQGGNIHIEDSSFAGNMANDGNIYLTNGILHITGCTFSGNRATYGAVLFAINSSTTISDSLIFNNTAEVTGILLINDGVLRSYNTLMLNNIASTGIIALTSCTAAFEGNTTLTNNVGSLYAVASDLTFEGHVNIANCTPFLTNSRAIPIDEGGAITIYQSSVKFNKNLTLTNNYAENGGALFISESRVSFNGLFTISNNHVSHAGGGIYLYHSRLNIQGQCRISDNEARKGGGIFGVGSTITLEDVPFSSASVVVFEFNSAKFGGALYLASSTKIYTLLIASLIHQINFIENAANYGGAVYIADETNLSLCNSSGSIISLQTECFIQILALYPPQLDSAIQFQSATISFVRNSAIVAGEAIFGGLLDRCTVNQLNPKREVGLIQGHLYLKSISNFNDTDVLASHPVRLCFCFFDQPDCSMKPPFIRVIKGQLFNVSLVAVDQVNHTLASNVTAFLSSNNGGLGEGQQYQSIENRCTNLSYNVFTPHNSEELLLNAVGPCGSAYLSQSRVQLTFLNCTCPIGFQPVAADLEINCRCECHSNITDYVEMCNSSTKTLKTKANTWISNTTISGLGETYLLVHPHCPYDYCHQEVTVNLNQLNGADDQCAFQRQGTLCGACQTGFSLSLGSSRCIECGRYWPLVLIGITLLAVTAGIALVSALLFLELTVAIGTLNGIIFYANIINGNASIYFKQLPTPNFPFLFIAWLNLDIGFDACLFDNIDAIAKVWLQLAFPIYLIILVVVIIVISKYSQRFSNLIGKKNPVATLATLILLSYAKILSTVITMLSLITLEYPDGQKVLWKPDATIIYLEFPKHAFLFLTGVLILVVGTAYTFILLFWQWLIRSPNWKIFSLVRNPKLLCFVETYHAPFKPKLRFWTGFLLLVRVILYLISALSTTGNPQVPLITTMTIAGSLLVLSTANTYKKNLVSILEVAIIYNIFVLTAVTWYTTDISASNSRLQSAAIYISTIITFTLFCCVVVYHSYMYTRIYYIVQKTRIVRKLNNLKIFKPQPKKERQNLDLHIEARDVDIFEMVDNSPNTNDYQLAQPQLEPQKVTVSIIKIPKHKEEKADS